MCIIRWNKLNYTISMNIYDYKHRSDVPIYKLRPEMYWFDFENPVYNEISEYNTDLCILNPQPCQIHAYPVQLTNIKYYNNYLDDKEMLIEAVKYTSDNEYCIINDNAKHINTGHGYAVK